MDDPRPRRPRSRSRRRKKLWIVVCALAAVAITMGLLSFGRNRPRRVTVREATSQLEQTATEERAKMADMVRNGGISGGDAALGRMKDQLEKAATQLGTAEAAEARAMAAYMGKMQTQVRDYQAAAKRFTEAQAFRPTLDSRAAIEPLRRIVREFLAQNVRLADAVRDGDALLRAEMDAAQIPARTRETTIAGFAKSQAAIRPLHARIRDCDRRLGEDALVALDLFEVHWGRWKRDPATGNIAFEDDATRGVYTALIERVQAAADEQTAAQEELAAVMKTGH